MATAYRLMAIDLGAFAIQQEAYVNLIEVVQKLYWKSVLVAFDTLQRTCDCTKTTFGPTTWPVHLMLSKLALRLSTSSCLIQYITVVFSTPDEQRRGSCQRQSAVVSAQHER